MPSSLAFGVPLLKSTNEYELSESSSPYFFGVLEVVESGLELLEPVPEEVPEPEELLPEEPLLLG